MENENMNNATGTPEENESVVEKITDTVTDAVNAVNEKADEVADTVADAVNAVNEKADEVADSVADTVTGANNTSNDAIRPDAIYNNPYAVPEQPQGSSVLAIISMICGIVSILGCCCYGLSIIPAIAALIMGIISKKKDLPGGGMALAGIITGAIGAIFAIIMIIILIIGMIGSAASTPSYYY